MLLLQQLIADAAGRPDQFGDNDDARGITEIDFPRRENVRQDAGAIITRNSFIRVGRKLNTISIRSLDIPRNAPSTWNVNAGNVVITMMKKIRNSTP